MSTTIATIKGIKESKYTKDYSISPEYMETFLDITRYYGGHKNGRMLQLTVLNDEGYIQLTKEQSVELASILLNAFNDNIYPSE